MAHSENTREINVLDVRTLPQMADKMAEGRRLELGLRGFVQLPVSHSFT